MGFLRQLCRPAVAPVAFASFVGDAIAAAHLAATHGPAAALIGCAVAFVASVAVLVAVVRTAPDDTPPPDEPGDGGGGGGSGPVPPPEPLPESGLGPDWWRDFERDLHVYVATLSATRASGGPDGRDRV